MFNLTVISMARFLRFLALLRGLWNHSTYCHWTTFWALHLSNYHWSLFGFIKRMVPISLIRPLDWSIDALFISPSWPELVAYHLLEATFQIVLVEWSFVVWSIYSFYWLLRVSWFRLVISWAFLRGCRAGLPLCWWICWTSWRRGAYSAPGEADFAKQIIVSLLFYFRIQLLCSLLQL